MAKRPCSPSRVVSAGPDPQPGPLAALRCTSQAPADFVLRREGAIRLHPFYGLNRVEGRGLGELWARMEIFFEHLGGTSGAPHHPCNAFFLGTDPSPPPKPSTAWARPRTPSAPGAADPGARRRRRRTRTTRGSAARRCLGRGFTRSESWRWRRKKTVVVVSGVCRASFKLHTSDPHTLSWDRRDSFAKMYPPSTIPFGVAVVG